MSEASATSGLAAHEIANDPKTPVPVVFLHGFGGLGTGWRHLQTAISFHAPTLAFDMPGHGHALNYPGFGPPKVAAKAVVAELAKRGIAKAHFVGHSMGGAIASLIGLLSPHSVASLTLLAPGGYGPQFNHPVLMRWAAAKTTQQLGAVMPAFFAQGFKLPEKAIELQLAARSVPGAVEALVTMAKAMSSDGRQGVLPVDEVLAGGYPLSIVWGEEDQILPVSQAKALQGRADLHILQGVGHSPAEEAPDLVNAVIVKHIERFGTA